MLKSMIGAVLGLALSACAGQAATVGFSNISGGDTGGDGLVSRFSLEVTSFSTSKVLIQVKSAAATGASYFIGRIFIDDLPGAALSGEASAFSATNSSTFVSFSTDRRPGNLPQGANVNFGTTTSYSARNGSGNAWAVQPGEVAGFLFTGTASSVLAALAAGTLRFGLHVQNLPGCDDGSDSYVTRATPAAPQPVPVPASGLLMLAALGLLGGRQAFKRQVETPKAE